METTLVGEVAVAVPEGGVEEVVSVVETVAAKESA